ncbi:NADH:flavin oxidoreductase [Mesorhizobium sp. CA18]|uniref:oxidoreductase n=1 Tax=unclassified Mesorhizobium TaxID=325217 RepID=UPI001CC93F0A|nr:MULTISPECIES: NADH:flavin oxidoreductase [unclassified Mesorhizobium]MBZ9737375.1 NADH:flavin oxidoreductase [Mesorhizobium sp. CA9]MBZ9829310.1 NADH:flavin oxidoreductase [Mesorhizobium sp. CA18]MBZ9834885.1 NADH:flavin oxidoreductase [Mesorhizobium sp. CA2]MBZ9840652.1 NADH:flavin oxidoreductase [Mesorhizobium sp. CA3]MBZ9878845.1 NADH:flavin oxidoreductase [Mesorhizobium sp. Ca11]
MSVAATRAGTASSDPLLQPFRLKGLMLRNRIVSTSHASMLDEGGLPLERYRRYHEEKARGGLAMTMVGGSAMTSPDSSWGGGQLDLSSDRIVPHLQSLSHRIHRHGAAVMCQVSHLGRRATAYAGNWLPPVAPSRVREMRNRNFPKEMDGADIDRIVKDYASAARRCVEGGLDGVETVTGGHLIGQFLSRRTNRRTDAFGGSLENRARFGLMVHEAIRHAVGNDFAVGIRFVIDEAADDGSNFEECLAFAKLFEREGHIDFFNCIVGRMDTDLALAEQNMPGMFTRSAPFLPLVGQFKRETRLPVIHAAGIRDVATARHAIRENLIDLVGMTRAHIADPNIVNKVMRGEEERIRPCVGASYCLYKKVQCIHNPASGHETIVGHVIDRAETLKRVVVVGGGPGGMEAARIAAERGHKVTLLEAGARLGGQVLVAASAHHRKDLIGIVDWRVDELARLGVAVRLNTYADAELVLAEKPDAVIVATGGIPDMQWLDGAEHCDSVWDVLTGVVPAKEDVLIYDETGRQAAISCALHLARQGRVVSLAMTDDTLAIETPYPDRVSFRKLASELGVRVAGDLRLVKVARQGDAIAAMFRHELTGAETEMTAAQLIIERGTVPVEETFQELRGRAANDGVTDLALMMGASTEQADGTQAAGSFVLHRIGDAVASRDVYSSIYEAYRLCSRL